MSPLSNSEASPVAHVIRAEPAQALLRSCMMPKKQAASKARTKPEVDVLITCGTRDTALRIYVFVASELLILASSCQVLRSYQELT